MSSMKTAGISERIDWAYQAKNPFRTLLRLLDGGVLFYVWVTAVFTIKATPNWLIAIFLARLIDVLAHPATANFHLLIGLGVTMLLTLPLNIPLHTLFVDALSKNSRGLERRLRLAVARRLQQLSISFHQSSASGRLQSKLLRDVEQVQIMAMGLGADGTAALVGLSIAIGYTAFNEPRMLLFYVLVVPITVAISRQFRAAIHARNADYRVNLERMTTRVVEMVEMLPLARAHGVEDAALNTLSERVIEVNRNGRLLDRITALFQSTTWVIFQLFNLSVIGVSCWFVIRGWMTVGDLVLYQTFFSQLINSINQLLNLYPVITRGSESIRSLGEILQSPDIEHNAGKAVPAIVRGEISFNSVSFKYPGTDRLAIRELDLTIPQGKTVAFVGASGSGKSTLISLAIGFIRPQAGQILLDGADMESIDMRAWRSHLSLVPQQIVLFNGSIRENILFGLGEVRQDFFDRVLDLTHVSEFVDRLPDKLDTLVGDHGARLSGGQKQRIAIARALMRDPKVIVLDEPTSALDLESEYCVQQALRELTKDRTTIIVAHRLSTIRNADLVCVMAEGQIVESGTHDELLALNGAFTRLHTAAGATADEH